MMLKNFREASLSELLDDPLTAIMMRRDGVTRDALTALIASVAERRAETDATEDGAYADEPLRFCLCR
jgi:hypothetical protein